MALGEGVIKRAISLSLLRMPFIAISYRHSRVMKGPALTTSEVRWSKSEGPGVWNKEENLFTRRLD